MPLAHIERGVGTPVVLLHAFPLSSAMWEASLERLAPTVRALAPDLPGFGRSARLPQPSIAGMATEVLSWLDALGLHGPIVLCGLSMGGYVAFEVFRQAPQRVRALGLCSTRAEADTPEQREARFALIERVEGEGIPTALSGTLSKLLGRTTLERRPAVVEYVRARVADADPGGVIDALRAMAGRRDSTDLLARITCPVLVAAGAEDALIPAATAQALAQRLTHASVSIIPQAGHLVNLEQPMAFHDALLGFLAA